jgi:hypothetical protein
MYVKGRPCNFLENGLADAHQQSKLIRSIKPIGSRTQ